MICKKKTSYRKLNKTQRCENVIEKINGRESINSQSKYQIEFSNIERKWEGEISINIL